MDETKHHAHTFKRQRGSAFPQTTDENELFHASRQIQAAKKARDFRLAVGNPTTKDLENMIESNVVRNCDVTVQGRSPDDQLLALQESLNQKSPEEMGRGSQSGSP